VKKGKIIREIFFKNNPEYNGRVELEKKWLLTGFECGNKNKEADESHTDGYRPI
jgi:hypothetical protein